MKDKILYLIVGVLLVCDIMLLYVIRQNKIESDSSMEILYPYAQKYTILRRNAEHFIKYSNSIVKDMEILGRNDVLRKLSTLFADGEDHLFLLRISDRYCNSCVKYFLDIFKSKQLNSGIDFVFLTGFQNSKHFHDELQSLESGSWTVYNIPFIENPIDYEGFPYFMVLNKDLMIEYCYFPSKGSDCIDIENINMIIDCYAKKYNVEKQ